jgi:hypothetical protein
MKRILKVIFAVGLVVALATSANALTAGSIPGGADNDFIPTVFSGPQIAGYYGGQIYLFAGEQVNLKFEYFGAEAGYHNEFNFNGSELFAHTGGRNIAPNASTPLGSATLLVNPGLLNFSFDVNGDSGSVVNGLNPDDSGGAVVGPNFFVSFNPINAVGGPTSGQFVWIFLDDGGAGPDDNHDDMLVRISIENGSLTVPEPLTLILLGSGLLGLAAIRRKK